jgi:flavorubredoxin
MGLKVQLAKDIFWLGFNDRRKHLFENHWPLEKGVTYNAYLLIDDKTVLIDTAEAMFSGALVDWVKELLNGRTLDYLVINHMEPDHSGSVRDILEAYPEVTVVGNRKTLPLLQGFYRFNGNFNEVADGEKLSVGRFELSFHTIPMVHWPESMVTFEHTNKILFSNDAFGSFGALDGGVFDDEVNLEWYADEIARYYSNIVGKYGPQVQKALHKLSALDIKMLAPSHGIIWRSELSYILKKYDVWSKFEADPGVVIVFGSMYGNTEKIADQIARQLSEAGVKNIRVFDSAKTHVSYIINEMWKYNGVILGSCAYNGGIFPPMAHLMSDLEHIALKNRFLGIFGSSGWGGGGVRAIQTFAENIQWEVVAEPVEARCSANESDNEQSRVIATVMAQKVLGK